MPIQITAAAIVLANAIGIEITNTTATIRFAAGESALVLPHLRPHEVVPVRVHDLRLKREAGARHVDRLEDHGRRLPAVVAEHRRRERDQHEEGAIDELRPIRVPSKRSSAAKSR
jgi:hypothetical protein